MPSPTSDPRHLLSRLASFAVRARVEPHGDLSTLVATLRALAFLHQTHHWQSQGESFYGDHLLYDRLYETASKEVDALAEKSTALSPGSVGLANQAEMVSGLVRIWSDLPLSLAARSLAAERDFLAILKTIRHGQTHTDGTANLLDGIADAHEGHVYLLQQRCER